MVLSRESRLQIYLIRDDAVRYDDAEDEMLIAREVAGMLLSHSGLLELPFHEHGRRASRIDEALQVAIGNKSSIEGRNHLREAKIDHDSSARHCPAVRISQTF